jgi:hypothetical protein
MSEHSTLSPESGGLHVWLRADTWPTPKWYGPPGDAPLFGWVASRAKLKRYEDYLTHQLRARYMELEGDFRTVYANFGNTNTVDQGTAARIVDLLHLSREVLERDAPDLAAASAALDLVERYMVWTYPLHVAEARITTMYLRVETLPPRDRAAFTRQLDLVCDGNGKLKPGVGYGLRAVFDELIGGYNRHTLETQLSRGLQIRRLRILRSWGIVLLGLLVAASALTLPPTGGLTLPRLSAGGFASTVGTWLTATSIGLFGALGGFLSGLLQVRNARVTLAQYQQSMLRLQLRLLVGALVALLLYTLVAWKVVPGISVDAQGMYLLLAFASGFSERYFLKLLDLKAEATDDDESVEERQDQRPAAAPPDTPVGPHESAAGTSTLAPQRAAERRVDAGRESHT